MFIVVSPHDISYAVFGLVENGKIENGKSEMGDIERVETKPEGILEALIGFLKKHKLEPKGLEGIIVVRGPGSATALRAGLSVVNTFAFALDIPIHELENPDGLEIEKLISSIDLTEPKKYTIPFYGKSPNITTSKNK